MDEMQGKLIETEAPVIKKNAKHLPLIHTLCREAAKQ